MQRRQLRHRLSVPSLFWPGEQSGHNTVRLAVRAEPVEAHSPFDRLRANELKRTALSQVIQFPLAKELGAPSRPCEVSDGAAPPNRRITADAAFAYDDNVTSARDDEGKLADESFSLRATKELDFFKIGRFGFVVSGSLTGEAFRRFSDLGHVFGEVQGELSYPAYSPTVALFARSAVDHYKSELRRGYNYSAGIVLKHNFTQRGIGVTAQLAHNARFSKSRSPSGTSSATISSAPSPVSGFLKPIRSSQVTKLESANCGF